MHRSVALGLLSLAFASLVGCGADLGRVNDHLRAENFRLEQQTATLQQQVKDRDATIAALQEQLDQRLPRLETLPEARLQQLFTAQRVEIRFNTDAWDFDGNGTQDGFRVFFRPLGEDGEILPATGTLTLEAFDLKKEEGSQRLGRWTFTPDDMKKSWYSGLGLRHFAFNCPWQAPPQHTEITFTAHFRDALTGRVLTDQQRINLHLRPVATSAASQPVR